MLFKMVKGSERWCSSFREACRPVMKEQIQSHRWAGKPLSQKTWVMCPVLMLLKKPKMSDRSRAPAHPVVCVAWI